MIKLKINNEELSIYQTGNLKDLLSLLKLDKDETTIEINQRSVIESSYEKVQIRDGDRITVTKLYKRS